VSHANAALTPVQRLRLGKAIVEDGWSVATAAAFFHVSWPTANRWAGRYRQQLLVAALNAAVAGTPDRPEPVRSSALQDRSSRPHSSPHRTSQVLVRKIVHLRWKQRLGPVAIGAQLNMPASTVHAVLVRCRLNKLWHVDQRTGEIIRRYEHPHPGSLIHVDVKKLGNIPDGGGWRFVGRQQGDRNKAVTPGKPKNRYRNPLMGTAFVHTVIDDHSRVAYAEIHDDEKATTAVAVLSRAVAWFAARGVKVERVLSDNGSAYKSHLWRDTCAQLGIKVKKTRPYRPQTNGKIERFHRTLAEGWAFSRHYRTESARRNALAAWLHHYNHHRPHTAIGKQPPVTRLTNLPGQYT
jgi:transposase InsO family protein